MRQFWGRLFGAAGGGATAAGESAQDYTVALLAAALAVLVRAALDPILKGDHAFVIALLAVVYVSWRCGFLPGVVTLLTSMTAVVYFFVSPRGSFGVGNTSDQFAVAASLFCGVGCAALGHAQRDARRAAAASLAAALDRKAALEAEVAHRGAVEVSLRDREADLRESEARFRGLAEAVPQIAWVTRPDGNHEYFNPKWYEYTGQTEAESVGWGWATPLHPDDRGRSEARWKLATETGGSYEIEYRFRGRDGSYRWFLGRALPQRDEGGAVVRWFGTCTDIHDAKQLEERLRHAAGRFRLLTEAVPQMVWTTDAAGKVTYFNRRWLEYTGITVADSAGDGWRRAIHPDDINRLGAVWNEALRQCDERFTQEFRIRTQPAGEYRWVLSVAVPIRGEDGAVTEWVGTLTDIEDQKRQAETLERLVRERTHDLEEANDALRGLVEERRLAEEKVAGVAQELRRSNGELEQFAYVASHDLQEPLRKIQAFGDLLRNKYAANLPETGHEYVGKMQASAGRMSRLIDDLLAFSRVTTHARPFARTDLNATLADVVDDLEVRITKTGAVVDVGPLPVIDADPSQVRQLFQNLIGNALKFVRPGVAPVVRVRAEVADEAGLTGLPVETCRVSVEDNGIGFDEKYLGRIFQVFQRLHGREEYDGTGVGLAICRKIVDRHGGAITARSRAGEGATFVVSLPVRQGAGATAGTPPIPHPRARPGPSDPCPTGASRPPS